jgi:class 3 adenylate cyclase
MPPIGCLVNNYLPPIGCYSIFPLPATHCRLLGGMAENEGRLSQRHSQVILDDLKRVSDQSGISQVALVAASIRALAKTWDDKNELTFPFRVIPESTYREMVDLAARHDIYL